MYSLGRPFLREALCLQLVLGQRRPALAGRNLSTKRRQGKRERKHDVVPAFARKTKCLWGAIHPWLTDDGLHVGRASGVVKLHTALSGSHLRLCIEILPILVRTCRDGVGGPVPPLGRFKICFQCPKMVSAHETTYVRRHCCISRRGAVPDAPPPSAAW